MIFTALSDGFLTGLWLSMSFGPVFFMLIQTSINKGIKSAAYFDAGVFTSDLIYIVLAYFGAAIILANETYEKWIAIIGGIILVGIGVAPLFAKKETKPSTLELKKVSGLNHFGLFGKGFVINFLNPAVLFIWFGAAALSFSRYEGRTGIILLYFGITLLTYFGIDIAKIFLAIKLKRFLNPKALMFINRIAGLVIMIFGLWLIYKFTLKPH
jgi:threonine/homoserine/homoserine lactone efflux protein